MAATKFVFNPLSGNFDLIISEVINTEVIDITAPNITNGFITLEFAPVYPLEVTVDIPGGTAQQNAIDFTVSGAVLTWIGNLATIIAANDVLIVQYTYRT